MVNVLGAPSGGIEETMKGVNAAMAMPRSVVHWYGKGYRPGRKMGHINITADSHAEIDASLAKLLKEDGISEDVLPADGRIGSCPLVGVIMGSQSDLPKNERCGRNSQRIWYSIRNGHRLGAPNS